MKKIYIQPELICCVLQSKMMMALSGQTSEDSATYTDNGDGTYNLGNEVKVSNPNLWDNEW